MTAKQVFEYALVELKKEGTSTLLIDDYNYFINKAIYQFANKVYNIYDLS